MNNLELWSESSSAHLNVFVKRYNKLLVAAHSLVRDNREHAIDLVHDTLIEFVRQCPKLCDIKNLDGYLHRMMHNLYKKQRQRAASRLTCELSIENYDWVECAFPEIADRCHSPHLLLQMQDSLRIICEYACFRKQRMKIGSVLILRFFHGYHTSEIAQIMRVTPSAVSHQLKLAQTEVHLYLNDPTRFSFYREISDARGGNGLNYGSLVDDLVEELHRAIFLRSSFSKCALYSNLCKLYNCQYKEGINCETLAHIVSCANCLSAVSTILGLDLPAIRNPTNELNRWASAKGDGVSQQTILKRAPVIYQRNQPFVQVSCSD